MSRFQNRHQRLLQSFCDDWNKANQIGTVVVVKTRTGNVRARTTTRAKVVDGLDWVCVHGLGRVPLSNVKVYKSPRS